MPTAMPLNTGQNEPKLWRDLTTLESHSTSGNLLL